jgi:hypothetical protein
VNEKYLIIIKASIFWRGDKRIILMDVLAREPLNREDLNAFKKKIQANFSKKLIIRLKTFPHLHRLLAGWMRSKTCN